MGNMTISYAGLERLGEMLRTRAFDELWHEARLLVAKRYMTWRGVAAQTFGPFVPAVLWQALQRAFGGRALKPESYSALSAERLAALDLGRLAAERDTDLSYRPRHDGFAARVWMLERVDLGNYNKGCLAGWQVDQRDPTADKRLVEFCLALPGRRFLADGVPRALGQAALADRLPRAVLSERRKGYQGADWHEGLAAARDEVGIELERLAGCAAAAKTLDLPRLKSLLAAMPNVGWERAEIVETYRLALLRGIAAGHFLRKAMGAN
jgi:asparagine synthase (glutamine-hydrolysing)